MYAIRSYYGFAHGRDLGHLGQAIHVAADQMAAQSVAERQRPLQVHEVARLERPEAGAAHGLGRGVDREGPAAKLV